MGGGCSLFLISPSCLAAVEPASFTSLLWVCFSPLVLLLRKQPRQRNPHQHSCEAQDSRHAVLLLREGVTDGQEDQSQKSQRWKWIQRQPVWVWKIRSAAKGKHTRHCQSRQRRQPNRSVIEQVLKRTCPDQPRRDRGHHESGGDGRPTRGVKTSGKTREYAVTGHRECNAWTRQDKRTDCRHETEPERRPHQSRRRRTEQRVSSQFRHRADLRLRLLRHRNRIEGIRVSEVHHEVQDNDCGGSTNQTAGKRLGGVPNLTR